MQIRCIRGLGDRKGPDIVDKLLTDQSVGRARCTREINASVSKKIEDANCPLLSFTNTGTHSQVSDGKKIYKGRVTFFSLTIDIEESGAEYFPSSSLRIQRVLK